MAFFHLYVVHILHIPYSFDLINRAGLKAAMSTVWLLPSRISSAIASPVAGALRMPQHE